MSLRWSVIADHGKGTGTHIVKAVTILEAARAFKRKFPRAMIIAVALAEPLGATIPARR